MSAFAKIIGGPRFTFAELIAMSPAQLARMVVECQEWRETMKRHDDAIGASYEAMEAELRATRRALEKANDSLLAAQRRRPKHVLPAFRRAA